MHTMRVVSEKKCGLYLTLLMEESEDKSTVCCQSV